MLSIRPEWCDLILRRVKSLEVRKTKPKLEPPFKCYIYETKAKTVKPYMDKNGGMIMHGRGQVIAEFICDRVEMVEIPFPAYQKELPKKYIGKSYVTYDSLHRYAGHDPVYFWHISKLKEYYFPKEISNFVNSKGEKIKNAPQSWGYVEEIR